MKTIRICIPAALHLMLFILLWLFMPKTENPGLQLATLATWSTLNMFFRYRKNYFFSQVISVLAVMIMSSMMFANELTLLANIDKIVAETFGLAPNVTTQSLIALILFVVVCAMNYLVDVTTEMFAGKVTRFKKLLSFGSKVFGPVAITTVMVGIGIVKNKTESIKTEGLINYAASRAPSQEDKALIAQGTDWRYSSLPQDILEEIKTFKNAPLVSGKIKVSILAPDPLKPGVIQVGYGITDMEIKEAIHYGFLPKGSKLPARLTKTEADKWFEQVTIPTYLAQVKEVVNPKIKLNGYQVIGLYSFCHNLGKDNLKSLVEGRLNDGNIEGTLENIGKYCNVIRIVKGKKVKIPYKGLQIRRAWEKKLLETETIPQAALEPPILL